MNHFSKNNIDLGRPIGHFSEVKWALLLVCLSALSAPVHADDSSADTSNDNRQSRASRYTLTIAPVPQNGLIGSQDNNILCGIGWEDCQKEYTAGAQVRLYATAGAGFELVSWEGNCSSTDDWSYLTMDANKTCTVIFGQPSSSEIEVFHGTTALTAGMTTPIEFGKASAGTPLTETFTLKNIGDDDLNITEIQLPTGFSLSAESPKTIKPNASANFTVQLNAEKEGDYQGQVNIINNDSDETQFRFVISGTVISERDLNQGSLKGNFIFPDNSSFPDGAEITVTARVKNADGVLEPLTTKDELVVEKESHIDIHAVITPGSDQRPVELMVIAIFSNQEKAIWYQKTPSKNMFSETGWQKLGGVDLAQPYVTPYGTHTDTDDEASYSVSVFKGKLPNQIDEIGEVKKVEFYIGYGYRANQAQADKKGYSYLVSWPITLQLP
jgi:hypothetical protein